MDVFDKVFSSLVLFFIIMISINIWFDIKKMSERIDMLDLQPVVYVYEYKDGQVHLKRVDHLITKGD